MSGDVAEALAPDLAADQLLDLVQRQTLRYFWDFAHPVSGLARERSNRQPDVVTTGGSGFGVMAILAGVERGWITRAEALDRLLTIGAISLAEADRFHGAFPHWLDGATGKAIAFSPKDDGGDLVETAFPDRRACFPCVNILTRGGREARASRKDRHAVARRSSGIGTPQNADVLYWHWSPDERMGDEPRDPRLERMSDHLCARGIITDASDPTRRVSSRLGRAVATSSTARNFTASACRSGRRTAGRSSSPTTRSLGSTRAA